MEKKINVNKKNHFIGKGKGKVKGKRTKIYEKISQNQGKASQEDVFCLFCGEQHIDPPTEDLLEC